VRPFMQPGKRSLIALSKSSGEIQLPKVPLIPSWGVGMVSSLRSVQMKVFDSTRATSAGLFGKKQH
ncbi:hypothetical protein DOY81_002827, partial [Sarcophaga bullata]